MTSEVRSRNISAIKSKNTKPEIEKGLNTYDQIINDYMINNKIEPINLNGKPFVRNSPR